MAREFLTLVAESALGTPMGSPVAGVTKHSIRLTDSNSFAGQADPVFADIAQGGGVVTVADTASDHYGVKFVLKTLAYPSQLPFLLQWAGMPVNTAQTAPWATSVVAGDLASVSAYHAVQRADGTYKRRRFAGSKVDSLTLEGSRQSTTWTVTVNGTACQCYGNQMDGTADPTATEFPAPADADYPLGPYTFKNSAGGFTSGTVRTQYETLSLQIQNTLVARWFEASHPTVLQFLGRKTTLSSDLYLQATPDDQTAYEALTAQACSLVLTQGTKSATIDMKGNNRLDGIPFDLPIGDVFMRKLSIMGRYDAVAGTDLAFTFTS